MIEILLYVLKLEDGCYYVGQSAEVHKRIQLHNVGKGAAWTRLHAPLALIECKRTWTSDRKSAETKENLLTLEMMKKYGWQKVRGGWFCQVEEEPLQLNLRAHGLFESLKNSSSEGQGGHPVASPSIKPNEQVRIAAIGSCDTRTRVGNYEVLVERSGKRQILKRTFTDTTVNRCIIHGLIDAVLPLSEPSQVTFIVATQLGLTSSGRAKGQNADLLKELIAALDKNNCTFTCEVVAGQGEELRRRIREN